MCVVVKVKLLFTRKTPSLLKVAEVAKRIIDAEHQGDEDDDGIFISAHEASKWG